MGGAGATAPAAETKDTPPLLIDGMECLPFQLQITYNNLEGAQCNRVITQSKPITKDRQVAEAGSTSNYSDTLVIYKINIHIVFDTHINAVVYIYYIYI